MNARTAAALAVAVALGVAAGCGGGGGKKSTTTTPSTTFDTGPLPESTTTTLAVDPALQALLLVAADLPGYTEPSNAAPATRRFTTCDTATAPAIRALLDAPSVEGSTFAKGAGGAVKVSSSVIGATVDTGGAGLSELVDPKTLSCLGADLKAAAEKDLPSGSTLSLKLTVAKSTVAGVDQAVLLSGAGTVKEDAAAGSSSTTSKTSKTVRYDLVFLRRGGTVLVVTFSGTADQATVVERQRIVAIAARKLIGTGAGTSPSTSTSLAAGAGSSTSSTASSARTTTTRRSTTTTSHGGSTTSTTKVGATTSTSHKV